MSQDNVNELVCTTESVGKFVFYDGECPICKSTVKLVEHSSVGVGFTFVPSSNLDDLKAHGLTRSQTDRYVAMVDQETRNVYLGVDVFILMLLNSQLKPVRILARLLTLRLLHKVACIAYDWISLHRHEISRLICTVQKTWTVTVGLLEHLKIDQ